MAFEPNRAKAFGHYVLSILLEKQGRKRMLRINRSDLATILGVQKLWENHVEEVRSAASEEGLGIADFGPFFLFFDSKSFQAHDQKVSEATQLTNKYADLYGSKAADEQLEKELKGLR